MNSLVKLWSASSIAIIGASERVGAMGRLPIEYLLKFGYKGAIYPVNPKGEKILGLTSYTSISAINNPIDLALIMVPITGVEEAVRQCALAKVSVVTVMGSGFAEAGSEGRELQNRLVAIAAKSGTRLVGPNCIGSVGGLHKLTATFSPVFSSEATKLSAGGLALVSQSGALGYGVYSLGLERGLPIGIVVTTGNEGDVSAMEVATVLADDKDVTGILIYAEGISNIDQLKKTASRKPTAILKAGRSDAGAKAAASHTGALATLDRVVDAGISSAGAVRVGDVEELLDAGAIFTSGKKLLGKKVAIITTSGGSGILGADALEIQGLELATLSPETISRLDAIIPSYGSSINPVDVTAAVMSAPDLFSQCLDILIEDSDVDAIVAAFCVLVGEDVEKIALALGQARSKRDIPIVVSRTGSHLLAPEGGALLAKENIPIFPTPERAIRALSILRKVSIPMRSNSRKPVTPVQPAPAEGASEVDLKNIWRSAGISVPHSRLITQQSEVIKAVEEVGGRAVFKAVIPGLLHKSEAGGVALDIKKENALETFEHMMNLSSERLGKVLVESFIPAGVEVLVGITPSPLGRVLTIGVGGVLTEIINDTSLRLLPVDGKDIEEMIDQTRLGLLLAGVRGAAKSDTQALIDTVLKITDATRQWPDGFELDINPVRILSDGAWVLDSAYIAPVSEKELEKEREEEGAR